MGIPGLSRFLNVYHKRYNETLIIRDSIVVIDGNNLMFFLLHPSGTNGHLVGGDWIVYSKTVREFFQHLHNCKITAVVIFDGVLEPEKFNTKLKRFRDAIKCNVHHGSPGSSYKPVALSTVFREILVEQRIFHYQTVFECDDTLAFIAKRLNCPLLSSDSDFYIYPRVRNVPLSAIDFRTSCPKKDPSKPTQVQKKVHVLAAKVLAIDRVCKNEFNFTDLSFLALGAVILGNDRISTSTFGNLLKSKATDRQQRIKYIFEWIGGHKDYNHVLEVISQTLKEEERNEILSLVKSVLQNYEGNVGEVPVWNAVIQDLKLNFQLQHVDEKCDLPLLLHTRCSHPDFIRQILINQFVFCPPQVEMPHMPPTHDLSLDIIRTIAGILLGEGQFTLFTRQRKNAVQLYLDTIVDLPGIGAVPTIRNAKFKNKATALFNSLFELNADEIAFIMEWPISLKFLIMVLLYFFKKGSGWSILRPLSVAVILVYLKPLLETTSKKCDAAENPSVADLMKQQILTKDLVKFFQRFERTVAFSKTHQYDISIAYVYCQFQSLLINSMRLSKLLGNPFRLPQLQISNSHFIYNVADCVVHQFEGNTQAFLEWYFDKPTQSSLMSIFTKFFNIVNQMSSKGSEMLIQPLVSVSEGEDSQDSVSEAEELLSDPEDEQPDDFISNRFSKLRVQ